jgi:hypothetical protein
VSGPQSAREQPLDGGGRPPSPAGPATPRKLSRRIRGRCSECPPWHQHPGVSCDLCDQVAVFHWTKTYPDLLLCAECLDCYPEAVWAGRPYRRNDEFEAELAAGYSYE